MFFSVEDEENLPEMLVIIKDDLIYRMALQQTLHE